MRFTVEEILSATGGELLYKNSDSVVCGVSRDSTEDVTGKLFVPIIGAKNDGHKYIESAVKKNAAGFLTSKREYAHIKSGFAILVDDTVLAMGRLAKYGLERSKATVIAITGSVGKTTTRQLTASILAKLGKTHVTINNYNNAVGLPLTIFMMNGDEKYVVLEMGMSHLEEISYLSKIACPDVAAITMIGMSHIENLKTRENIFRAKLEILDGMKKNGTLVVNGDDDMLSTLKGKLEFSVQYFGIENGDYPVKVIESDEKCVFEFDGCEYHINVNGIHNIKNACCAIQIAKLFKASDEQIQNGLDSFKNVSLRQEIYKKGNKEIILDCYNASLDSMRASLCVLKAKKAKRKVAILGAIGELGDYLTDILHEVGKSVFKNGVDLLIVCDENSHYIAEGAKNAGMDSDKILHFSTKAELNNKINSILKDGDCILIKASRAYEFEEIFAKIEG